MNNLITLAIKGKKPAVLLTICTAFLLSCSGGQALNTSNHRVASAHPAYGASASQQANWHWHKVNPTFSSNASQAIANDGLSLIASTPADIADYCPAYEKLNGNQRLLFWGDLLAAMSQFESSHNPAAFHVEKFNDRFGQPVVSRGLLQISQESANGYRCNITDAKQLHRPDTNIRCGVKILSRWVAADQRIGGRIPHNDPKPWRGGARYWSVLRNNHKTRSIQQNLRNSPLCRNAALTGGYSPSYKH